VDTANNIDGKHFIIKGNKKLAQTKAS